MDQDENTPTWSITESAIVQDTENFENHILSANLNDNSQLNEGSLGPTLLIGLDKNFFEQNDDTKDVIFIENTDLKFDSGGIKIDGSRQFLPSGNYLISFVDPGKSSSPWDSGTLRNIRRVRQENEQIYQHVSLADIPSLAAVDQEKDTPLFKHVETIDLPDVAGTSSQSHFNLEFTDKIEQHSENDGNLDGAVKQHDDIIKTDIEKNLPIKKKSKMKESLDADGTVCSGTKDENLKKVSHNHDYEAKKVAKLKRKRPLGKRRCCYSESDDSEEDTIKEDFPIFMDIPDVKSFQSIDDLIQDLRTREIIDDEFSKLIANGISEMKTDIMQEMIMTSVEENRFSYELLAFAFLLFFKKREAYNYVSSVFSSRWPTIADLKKWRALVNSKPRNKPVRKKSLG